MELLFKPIVLLLMAFAYLLGSVPVGFLLVRRYNKEDLSKISKGEFSANHVIRHSGFRLGAWTFVLDVLKGVLAVTAVYSFGYEADVQALAGLFAVAGHCFPVWMRFAGGKGLSTGLGVMFALSPITASLCICIYFVALVIFKMVSAAALLACIGAFMGAVIFIPSKNAQFIILATVVLIFLRHWRNIRGIITGTERRFNQDESS